jgi:hypothetical protein
VSLLKAAAEAIAKAIAAAITITAARTAKDSRCIIFLLDKL